MFSGNGVGVERRNLKWKAGFNELGDEGRENVAWFWWGSVNIDVLMVMNDDLFNE